MRRAIYKSIAGAALVIGPLLAAGCKEAEQPPPPPPPAVSVMTVQPQPLLLTTELPGRIVSSRVSEVRPQVSGLILRRLFTEGSDVEAGQVLYEIDPAPFQAAVDSAQANLVAAQKAEERAKAVLEASLANVRRQQATLDLAKLNLKRLENLVKERAVSESERDKAATDVDVAEATLQALQAQVESDRGALATAQAAIKQAEAALKTAEINLGYTRITAPISGRIGRSNVTEGAIVTAYQPLALATIQALDPVYLDVPQSTAELIRLRNSLESGRLSLNGNNQVQIILEDGTPYGEPGELKFREVNVDPSTGSVILRIEVPNKDGVLLPGMFARAIVRQGVDQQAILVPQSAITRDARGTAVAMVLDSEDKVQVRPLVAEQAVENQWLITEGLNVGDRLIVKGVQRLRPGMPVRIAEVLPATSKQPSAAAPTAEIN